MASGMETPISLEWWAAFQLYVMMAVTSELRNCENMFVYVLLSCALVWPSTALEAGAVFELFYTSIL